MKKDALKIYVGIGSSAGGLEALMELVSNLPKKSQFFYFLAQHHARGEENLLPELLQRKSTLDVHLVKKGFSFDQIFSMSYHQSSQLSIKMRNS